MFAELIGEARFRIAPLTDVDAEELVTGGKAGRLVAGFRGAPAANVPALADLVHRLARLGEDQPSLAELDLNPVLALADRCIAVDARARAAPRARRAGEVLVSRRTYLSAREGGFRRTGGRCFRDDPGVVTKDTAVQSIRHYREVARCQAEGFGRSAGSSPEPS